MREDSLQPDDFRKGITIFRQFDSVHDGTRSAPASPASINAVAWNTPPPSSLKRFRTFSYDDDLVHLAQRSEVSADVQQTSDGDYSDGESELTMGMTDYPTPATTVENSDVQ
jgi:hypothetical protein